MTNVSYVYSDDGDVSPEFNQPGPCVTEGAKRAKRRAPWVKYRVNVNDDVGELGSYAGKVDKATILLGGKAVGTTIRFQAVGRDGVLEQVSFRKMQDEPVANTEGVEGIDRFVGWVNAEARAGRLDGVRYAGICVCKHPSDHADCAAVDIFATDASMRKMVAEALGNADYYHTKYTILYREICYPSPGQCQAYFGDKHYHVHLSVNGGHHDAAC